MTARAEGFWWVRLGEEEPMRPLWYFGDSLMTHDPRSGGEYLAFKERVTKWGPYLGKEPGDQNRLPGLSRWGKVSHAGADCTCDWCHRLTESEVNAIEARLRLAEETPSP